MKYLMAISIGPVQSFIRAARKTRDLYVGSWVLSEVAKAAALELMDAGAELIFPAASREECAPNSYFTAVNRVLAIVGVKEVSVLSRRVREKAVGRLSELGRLKDVNAVGYDAELMQRHLANALEYYAAWAPCEGPEGFQNARARVDGILAGRKLLHDFRQHDGAAGRRKSSLDGCRETVITGRNPTPGALIQVREQEELDGLGMLKRFGRVPGGARFDSTTEVAALPYLQRIAGKEPWKEIEKFAVEEGIAGRQSELIYDHESREIVVNERRRERLRSLRERLYKECGRPSPPYLALLVADGDSMGDKISGLGLEEQKALSGQLSAFAREIRKKLDLECMTVFAGGDDVRAVLPLHRALDAAQAVRETFEETVKAGDTRFTISAGIAIVHALDPLEEGMQAAEDAERNAKEIEGKGALGITTVPRSGAPVSAVEKWELMLPLLRQIDEAYRADRLSFGFAHELRELLGRTPKDLDDVLPRMAETLAVRKKAQDSAAPELVKKACQRDDGDHREGLRHLLNAMLAVRRISRAS